MPRNNLLEDVYVLSLAKSIKQCGLYHVNIAKNIVKNSINRSLKELDQNVTISAIHKENLE